jgi:Mlc titration factor MtfA (ptsG expression regulator)
MFGYFKRRRRQQLRAALFPAAWLESIERNVPIFHRLPQADRAELQGHVQVFLAEKQFEGCGGLELNEEIKVTIAGQACLLLLHRDVDYFSRLVTILVYPGAYVATATRPLAAGVIREEEEVRLGEAWKSGVVVVSWASVRDTARGRNQGENLVLHEFAHQLDMEDGVADGTPRLEDRRQYERWGEVMGYEYERLRRDAELGRYSVLDPYGATDPAEFFAVATECFFEKALMLAKRHPELYDVLKTYYRQDPAVWPGSTSRLPGDDRVER